MIGEYDIDYGDLHPGPFVEPENPFAIYEREVGLWHEREEKAWLAAGSPEDFDFDEPYPVRPASV